MQSKKENILNQLLSSPQRQQFEQMLAQLRDRPAKIEDWSSIHSPEKSIQADYNFLKDSSNCSENFSRLVIGKLNGGLGTSMGCAGPKALLKVRDEKTFLDLIVEQVRGLNARWGANIPLLLMNSFYTEKEISKFVDNIDLPLISFTQNKFPRLSAGSLLPCFDRRAKQMLSLCMWFWVSFAML